MSAAVLIIAGGLALLALAAAGAAQAGSSSTSSSTGGSSSPGATSSSTPTAPGGAIASPSGLTVKGAPATQANVQAANTILAVAHQLGAPRDAAAAMVYAAIYESGLLEGGARNSLGYGGVLAGGTHFPTSDSVGQARAFLLGDSAGGYQAGGAIHLVQTGASIAEAAIRTEVPSIWPGNAYAGESGYGSDSRAFAEARAWVDAYGGFH